MGFRGHLEVALIKLKLALKPACGPSPRFQQVQEERRKSRKARMAEKRQGEQKGEVQEEKASCRVHFSALHQGRATKKRVTLNTRLEQQSVGGAISYGNTYFGPRIVAESSNLSVGDRVRLAFGIAS